MIFTIPLSIIGQQHDSYLAVEIPSCDFKKTYPMAGSKLEFEANTSRKPQKLILTYYSDVENNCVIEQPQITTQLIKNVPVRTISLKKNNIEISGQIDNLCEQWRYRSWSNPWLSNGDTVVYRYYWDFEAVRYMQS
jgi:hypothetical protein